MQYFPVSPLDNTIKLYIHHLKNLVYLNSRYNYHYEIFTIPYLSAYIYYYILYMP